MKAIQVAMLLILVAVQVGHAMEMLVDGPGTGVRGAAIVREVGPIPGHRQASPLRAGERTIDHPGSARGSSGQPGVGHRHRVREPAPTDLAPEVPGAPTRMAGAIIGVS